MLRYILCFWLLAQYLHAQPGFNIGYPIWHPVNHFTDVMVVNDTIIAYGIARDSAANFLQGILIAKFDTLGNLLIKTIVTPYSNNSYSINKGWGKIIATSDGGYAMTAGKVFGRDGVFVKVDHDLQVEFVREYVDTFNLGEFLVAPIEVPDGYLLYGYFNRPGNAKLDGLIRKVDKQGNPIWRKEYGGIYDLNEAFYYEMSPYNDTSFVFSGYRDYDLAEYGGDKPWLCIIDTSGALLFEWKPEDTSTFDNLSVTDFYPYADSTWLGYGKKFLGFHPQYDWAMYESSWVKFDADFQFLWKKPVGPAIYNLDRFSKILRAPNGDILAFGERGPYDPDLEGFYRKGWVMRFTAGGDSLWEWTGQMPLPGSLGTHFLSGGAMLSSGSIVAAGQGDDAEGQFRCWLVKLTPDGCVDTLYCNVVSALEPAWNEAGDSKLLAYPNPADVAVTLALADGAWLSEVALYDLNGNLVAGQTVPDRSYQHRLALAGLPSGLYIAEVRTTRGKVLYTRLIVR